MVIGCIVLAAGKSTRYKGTKTKLLENLAGLPLISHVYNIANKISGKNVVIVCNKNNIHNLKGCLKFKKNCEQSKKKLLLKLKNNNIISKL